MIYVITFLLIINMFTLRPAVARDFPYADAVTFLGTEGAARQLKKAVFAVQIQGNLHNTDKADDWHLAGSGFFVAGEKSAILGVTCFHVVAKPLADGKQLFLGIETANGYQRTRIKVVHVDVANDIAILVPLRKKDEQIEFKNLVFPEEMFDDDKSLVEGRGVLIPGYPLQQGIEDDKNHPVIRLGIIAQFTGKRNFLIDGVASHGNSGSPVFALNYKNHKLVGMVTSHLADTINLHDEGGRLAARLPYNSGLARSVTMRTILDALKKAVGKY